jgi:hypothetical protein
MNLDLTFILILYNLYVDYNGRQENFVSLRFLRSEYSVKAAD